MNADNYTMDPVVVEDPADPQEAEQPVSIWMLAIMQLCIAIATVAVGFVIYTHFFAKTKTNFGYVDIKTVVDTGQLKFTAKIANQQATDADRAAAYDYAASFGRDLSKTLDAVQQQCECVLMTKAAMIVGGDSATDYTPQVLKALNLEGLDITSLQSQIVGEFAKSATPSASAPQAMGVPGVPGMSQPNGPAGTSSVFGVPLNAK